MQEKQPCELFKSDFERLLLEAEIQESLLAVNKGEYVIASKIYCFYADFVIPAILHDDWVYEATYEFATDFVNDCFRAVKRMSKETIQMQTQHQKLNVETSDFLARAIQEGWAHQLEDDLPKASDFISILNFDKLSKLVSRQKRYEARQLHKKLVDHEEDQLWLTLLHIREHYEITLSRIMYVISKVIALNKGLKQGTSDNKLWNISERTTWFENHIDGQHLLHDVFGRKALGKYRRIRNVASHQDGYQYKPKRNEIILKDRDKALVCMSVHEFQQLYRLLAMYTCEFGIRAILAAFCMREQGSISISLQEKYLNTFPKKP